MRQGLRIEESSRRFLEANAVPPEVRNRLGRIPLDFLYALSMHRYGDDGKSMQAWTGTVQTFPRKHRRESTLRKGLT